MQNFLHNHWRSIGDSAASAATLHNHCLVNKISSHKLKPIAKSKTNIFNKVQVFRIEYGLPITPASSSMFQKDFSLFLELRARARAKRDYANGNYVQF